MRKHEQMVTKNKISRAAYYGPLSPFAWTKIFKNIKIC